MFPNVEVQQALLFVENNEKNSKGFGNNSNILRELRNSYKLRHNYLRPTCSRLIDPLQLRHIFRGISVYYPEAAILVYRNTAIKMCPASLVSVL